MKKIILLLISIFTDQAYAQSGLIDIAYMKKNSTPIKRVVDDVLIIQPNSLLKIGDHVVAVRYYEDNLEVIARGQIGASQNGELLATLERGSITKPPANSDFIITLSKLNGQQDPEPFQPQDNSLEPAKDSYEPGYIQIGLNQISGNFEASGSSQVNSYKKYTHTTTETSLLWYFDFLWRVGIEYSFHESSIPLKSYDRLSRATVFNESRFALHYRLLPIWKELRPNLKLISLNSSFLTANNDEYVVPTTYTGTGFGVHWHYLFNDNLFTSQNRYIGWSWNRAYLDTDYFFSYSALDGKVSRGEGAGQRLDLKLGVVGLFYIKKIPFFKRYFVDLQLGYSMANFTFSGTPKSAIDGFYQIPSGASATESENYVKISIGVRMDDVISKILKGRDL